MKISKRQALATTKGIRADLRGIDQILRDQPEPNLSALRAYVLQAQGALAQLLEAWEPVCEFCEEEPVRDGDRFCGSDCREAGTLTKEQKEQMTRRAQEGLRRMLAGEIGVTAKIDAVPLCARQKREPGLVAWVPLRGTDGDMDGAYDKVGSYSSVHLTGDDGAPLCGRAVPTEDQTWGPLITGDAARWLLKRSFSGRRTKKNPTGERRVSKCARCARIHNRTTNA